MAEDIVVRYRAEVDELTRQLKLVAERMETLEKESKQAAKGLDQTTKAADALDKELSTTGKSAKQATDNLKSFGREAGNELKGLQNTVSSVGKGIAAGIAAAFTIDAVIEFGKSSVNAFLEAQDASSALEFTIKNIAGASSEAVDSLIAQSKELERVTVFSATAIQKAQTSLANFGLTARQIEDLLPKLADFASATKRDIESAANVVGSGLQGMGKDLEKFGIEVSATNTQLENLNNITDGFGKFAGKAAQDTQTLSGQLKDLQKEADNLQQTVGEELAPAWVKVRKATFEATLAIIDYFKAGGNIALAKFSRDVKEAGTVTDEVTKKVKEQTEVLVKSGITQEEAYKKALDIVKKDIELRKERQQLTLTELEQEKNASQETIDSEKRRANLKLTGINNELREVNKLIDVEKQRQAELDRTLTREKLRLFTAQELNKALLDNKEKNDTISKSNVDLIEREIEARKKALLEREKEAEKIRKLIEQIKNDEIKASNEEREARRKADQEFFDDLAKRQKALEDAIRKTKELNAEAEEIRLDSLLAERSTGTEKERLRTAKVFETELLRDLENEKLRIRKEAQFEGLEAQREADDKIVILEKQTVDAIKEIYSKLGLVYQETSEQKVARWFDENEEILNASIQLVNSLVQLWDNYNNSRLQQLQEETDAQLNALDERQKLVDDNLEKRRISEAAAQAQTEKLTKERVEIEKRAAAEEKKIKRRQFEIDKAAAIVEITINTAQAIVAATKSGNPIVAAVLAALFAATGAAQLAIVSSQPNPYRKGSKNTKEGLARVGEEGEEVVFMPGGSKVLPAKQTKTYGQVLDAMFDNRFEKYVMQNYVTPALQKQQRTFEANKQTTFANKVGESIVLNTTGMTANEMERIRKRGQVILNADEIGRSVANHIKIDPYRL